MIIKYCLFFFFVFSFSYAHLPFEKYHHGLSSLFNYVIPLLILLIVINYKKIFISKYLKLIIILSLFYIIISLIQIGKLFFYNSVDFNEKSLHIFTTALIYIVLLTQVIAIIGLANFYNFNFLNAISAIKISSIILIIYLLIELIGNIYKLSPFDELMARLTPFLQYRLGLDYSTTRLRGLSNEPSYLGVVIVFLISALLSLKNITYKDYILIILLIILASFSMSKSILISIIIILILCSFYNRKIIFPSFFIITSLVYHFYIQTLSLDSYVVQYKDLGYDISTITRVGSWAAAWNGFLDAPVFGHGFGVAGKDLLNYYPEWFFKSPEALIWIDLENNYGIPVFSNLFRVLFEGGLFGAIFFIYFISCLIRFSNNRSYFSQDNALLIVGFSLAFMMVDQLSYWPFFIILGLNRSDEIFQK